MYGEKVVEVLNSRVTGNEGGGVLLKSDGSSARRGSMNDSSVKQRIIIKNYLSKVILMDDEILSNTGPGLTLEFVRCELFQVYLTNDNNERTIHIPDPASIHFLTILNDNTVKNVASRDAKKKYIVG